MPGCGPGTQTRLVTCLASDGTISERCGGDKPSTERRCNDPCLDTLEESGGSDSWGTLVDGQYVSVYIDHHGSERTISANLTQLGEFLELPNCCSTKSGFTYILLFRVLQGRID